MTLLTHLTKITGSSYQLDDYMAESSVLNHKYLLEEAT